MSGASSSTHWSVLVFLDMLMQWYYKSRQKNSKILKRFLIILGSFKAFWSLGNAWNRSGVTVISILHPEMFDLADSGPILLFFLKKHVATCSSSSSSSSNTVIVITNYPRLIPDWPQIDPRLIPDWPKIDTRLHHHASACIIIMYHRRGRILIAIVVLVDRSR